MAFVGLPGDGDRERIDEWVEQYGVTAFPHVYDPSGQLWADYGVISQPSTVLIAADGSQERIVGAIGPHELADKVELLLG